jgi:bifunctional non-homologous end joining protein LigD
MLLRSPARPTLAVGFVWPCLPTSAPRAPSGRDWLHEVKHDGFRVIAHKIGNRVKLYSRSGNDLTYRFPLIVEAVAKLRVRSCIIDGEAVACGDDGIASFNSISAAWSRARRVFPQSIVIFLSPTVFISNLTGDDGSLEQPAPSPLQVAMSFNRILERTGHA